MKPHLQNEARRWAWATFLSIAIPCRAEQFVELTAEIQCDSWSWWFFCDGVKSYPGDDNIPSIFPPSYTVRCVVGSNVWMMESDGFSRNAHKTLWFTGTNIIEHTLIIKQTSDEMVKKLSKVGGLAMSAPPVGQRSTKVYESEDGHPGRPVRVADLMPLREKLPWLAFCSGSFLKREGRKIFPPGDLWKETGPWEFSDSTKAFDDGLCLPNSLELYTKETQPVVQYQVRQTTNVLGWNFPLEFYLVQYQPVNKPAKANAWEVNLTAKGRVISIKQGTKPEIPPGL